MSSDHELTNAIWSLLDNETLPPENVIQVVKLYLKDDRIVSSQRLLEKIVHFYLAQDRTDVWNLIGTQYLSTLKKELREFDLEFLEVFRFSFKTEVKEMIANKKMQKKLRTQIDF